MPIFILNQKSTPPFSLNVHDLWNLSTESPLESKLALKPNTDFTQFFTHVRTVFARFYFKDWKRRPSQSILQSSVEIQSSTHSNDNEILSLVSFGLSAGLVGLRLRPDGRTEDRRAAGWGQGRWQRGKHSLKTVFLFFRWKFFFLVFTTRNISVDRLQLN